MPMSVWKSGFGRLSQKSIERKKPLYREAMHLDQEGPPPDEGLEELDVGHNRLPGAGRRQHLRTERWASREVGAGQGGDRCVGPFSWGSPVQGQLGWRGAAAGPAAAPPQLRNTFQQRAGPGPLPSLCMACSFARLCTPGAPRHTSHAPLCRQGRPSHLPPCRRTPPQQRMAAALRPPPFTDPLTFTGVRFPSAATLAPVASRPPTKNTSNRVSP